MKRVLVSFLGGILLPVSLFSLASFVSWLLPQYDLGVTKIGETLAPGYIFAPVALPIYAYIIFPVPVYYFISPIWFGFIASAVFDFFLYAILTFIVIKYFELFDARSKTEPNAPPPPPEAYSISDL
jgi:hypothetical protein